MIGPLKSKEPHLRSFFSSAGDMVPTLVWQFLQKSTGCGGGMNIFFSENHVILLMLKEGY
jgi:hypothetical protein